MNPIEKVLALFRPRKAPPRVVVLVKADVKNPGSRGGVFHRTGSGKVTYGRYTPGGGVQAEAKASAASTKVPGAHRAAEFHLRAAGFNGKVTHDVTPLGAKPRLHARAGDLSVSMIAEKDGTWSVRWGDGKGDGGNHGHLQFRGHEDAAKAMSRVLKGDTA